MKVSDDLILAAARDLVARDKNAGSWVSGLPDSFREVADGMGLDRECDPAWVLTVEHYVRFRCTEGFVVSSEEIVQLRARASGGVVPSVTVRHQSPGG